MLVFTLFSLFYPSLARYGLSNLPYIRTSAIIIVTGSILLDRANFSFDLLL